VLDNIVQTAVKDFIDISQQVDVQDGSYDGNKEKLEMYMYVIHGFPLLNFCS
jgi:hypothetical protein